MVSFSASKSGYFLQLLLINVSSKLDLTRMRVWGLNGGKKSRNMRAVRNLRVLLVQTSCFKGDEETQTQYGLGELSASPFVLLW